jgi:hypothetical protein
MNYNYNIYKILSKEINRHIIFTGDANPKDTIREARMYDNIELCKSYVPNVDIRNIRRGIYPRRLIFNQKT